MTRPLHIVALTLSTTLAIGFVPTEIHAQDSGEGARGQGEGGQRSEGRRGGRGGEGARGQDGEGRRGGQDGGRGRGGQDGGRRGGFGSTSGRGWTGIDLRPTYLSRDMVFFVDHLELGDDQKPIVETMLRDYEAAFEVAADAADDSRDALRPMWGPSREERSAEQERLVEAVRQLRDEINLIRAQLPEGEAPDPRLLEDIRAKLAPINEQMDALEPSRPEGQALRDIISAYSSLSRDWRHERNALDAAFMADLQIVLSERQLTELWPPFERFLRREKTLSRGRLSGESTDLFDALRQAEIVGPALDSLIDLTEAYSIELDQALIRRNDYLDGDQYAIRDIFFEGDTDRAIALMQEEVDVRTTVRDVNESYGELLEVAIVDSMGAERSEAFRDAVNLLSFDDVYEKTRTQSAFEAAKDLEDIDDETLALIEAIETQFLAELARHNDKLRASLLESEPEGITRRVRAFADRMDGGPRTRTESPTEELWDARRDLEDTYRDRLEGLLTDEQIDELPRRSRRRGDWGGRNRGNDDNQQRGNRGGDRSERERGNRGGDDERRNNWTREYDLDGDGDLGEAERALLRDEWRNRRDNENARGNREGGGEAGGGARGGGRGGRGGDN